MTFHPFHIVERSPWPLTRAIRSLFITSGIIALINKLSSFLLLIGIITCLLSIYQWWRDISRESTFQGYHTQIVVKGIKLGIILFIISEILFFFSFFWTYFHAILSPDIEIGQKWPPTGISPFNPYHIPLLNTIILLSSGVTITWTHHALINKNFNNIIFRILITIILGIYFSILQLFEYIESSFTIRDRIFGRIFFLRTGFHGIHVLIGTTFIFINFLRIIINHYNNKHHFGFEARAWYWHFVDVVWLFLYTFVYWWIF